jgi:hypothetical protein
MRFWLTGLLFSGLVPVLVGITTPASGAVLRGSVSIVGSSQVESGNFAHTEVAFAYAGDLTGTWFLIGSSDQPVVEGVLATWDTTTISDGDYSLRLRVFLQDGTTMDVTVTDLHVRNDAPAQTATPPVAIQDLPTFEPSPSPAAPEAVPASATAPAPRALPGNPAEVTENQVLSTFRRGAVFAVISVALIGLFLRLRSMR